jgi:hypothetical protein
MRFDQGMVSKEQRLSESDIPVLLFDVASDAVWYRSERLFGPSSLPAHNAFAVITLFFQNQGL